MDSQESDSSRAVFSNEPPTLDHLHRLRDKLLSTCVKVWLCAYANEKITCTVGKPAGVQRILGRLSANPDNTFAKREDSLLLRAFMCRLVTDMTLKVEVEEERPTVNEVIYETLETVRAMFDECEFLTEIGC